MRKAADPQSTAAHGPSSSNSHPSYPTVSSHVRLSSMRIRPIWAVRDSCLPFSVLFSPCRWLASPWPAWGWAWAARAGAVCGRCGAMQRPGRSCGMCACRARWAPGWPGRCWGWPGRWRRGCFAMRWQIRFCWAAPRGPRWPWRWRWPSWACRWLPLAGWRGWG